MMYGSVFLMSHLWAGLLLKKSTEKDRLTNPAAGKEDPVAPKRGIVACASCESSRQLKFSSCLVLSAVILADSCLWSSRFDAG